MSDLSLNEVDALLDALREVPEDDKGVRGITAPELAEALGVSVEVVRTRLKRLMASGKAKPVRVRRERMDGITHTVSGYRIAS